MTTLTSRRGTSTINAQGLVFGKRSSKLPKNETITTKRGTDVIKVEDIPNVQKADPTGQIVTVNRGTAVKTL